MPNGELGQVAHSKLRSMDRRRETHIGHVEIQIFSKVPACFNTQCAIQGVFIISTPVGCEVLVSNPKFFFIQ